MVEIMPIVAASEEMQIPHVPHLCPISMSYATSHFSFSLAFFKVMRCFVSELTLINSCHYKFYTGQLENTFFFPYTAQVWRFFSCIYTEKKNVYLESQMSGLCIGKELRSP